MYGIINRGYFWEEKQKARKAGGGRWMECEQFLGGWMMVASWAVISFIIDRVISDGWGNHVIYITTCAINDVL